MPDRVSLELEEEIVHGPNSDTSIVFRWAAQEGRPAMVSRLQGAADIMGNRQPWAVTCDVDKKILWFATGAYHGIGKGRDIKRHVAKTLQRIDFSDPGRIVARQFDRWPADAALAPSDGCRAELEVFMKIGSGGAESYRYVTWGTAGSELARNAASLYVFGDKNGETYRVDLYGKETPSTLKELPGNIEAGLTKLEEKAKAWHEDKPHLAKRDAFRITIGLPPVTTKAVEDQIVAAFTKAGSGPVGTTIQHRKNTTNLP
jgi:hypothetical protein